MRVLLSTIGSRGDVQPLVALALELKALGEEVRLCVPPDFQQWIEALGLPVTPIGPELRRLAAAPAPASAAPLSPERRRKMIFTSDPWLAADPTLAPWPDRDAEPFQPGAWLVPDERALPTEIESFLDAGDPPVYLGFGSMRATDGLGGVMIEAARALGRRAIVSRGWAELAAIDDAADCLTIDEVNQQALFRRVAAVVHHGGTGTTTAAARAGVPQAVVPQMYDQPYWAARVEALGIGIAHPRGAPTVESLAQALARALQPEVGQRAGSLAASVRGDGARGAARRLAESHRRR